MTPGAEDESRPTARSSTTPVAGGETRAVEGSSTTPVAGGETRSTGVGRRVPPRGPERNHLVYFVARILLRVFFRVVGRYRVAGMENVPKKGATWSLTNGTISNTPQTP